MPRLSSYSVVAAPGLLGVGAILLGNRRISQGEKVAISKRWEIDGPEGPACQCEFGSWWMPISTLPSKGACNFELAPGEDCGSFPREVREDACGPAAMCTQVAGHMLDDDLQAVPPTYTWDAQEMPPKGLKDGVALLTSRSPSWMIPAVCESCCPLSVEECGKKPELAELPPCSKGVPDCVHFIAFTGEFCAVATVEDVVVEQCISVKDGLKALGMQGQVKVADKEWVLTHAEDYVKMKALESAHKKFAAKPPPPPPPAPKPEPPQPEPAAPVEAPAPKPAAKPEAKPVAKAEPKPAPAPPAGPEEAEATAIADSLNTPVVPEVEPKEEPEAGGPGPKQTAADVAAQTV